MKRILGIVPRRNGVHNLRHRVTTRHPRNSARHNDLRDKNIISTVPCRTRLDATLLRDYRHHCLLHQRRLYPRIIGTRLNNRVHHHPDVIANRRRQHGTSDPRPHRHIDDPLFRNIHRHRGTHRRTVRHRRRRNLTLLTRHNRRHTDQDSFRPILNRRTFTPHRRNITFCNATGATPHNRNGHLRHHRERFLRLYLNRSYPARKILAATLRYHDRHRRDHIVPTIRQRRIHRNRPARNRNANLIRNGNIRYPRDLRHLTKFSSRATLNNLTSNNSGHHKNNRRRHAKTRRRRRHRHHRRVLLSGPHRRNGRRHCQRRSENPSINNTINKHLLLIHLLCRARRPLSKKILSCSNYLRHRSTGTIGNTTVRQIANLLVRQRKFTNSNNLIRNTLPHRRRTIRQGTFPKRRPRTITRPSDHHVRRHLTNNNSTPPLPKHRKRRPARAPANPINNSVLRRLARHRRRNRLANNGRVPSNHDNRRDRHGRRHQQGPSRTSITRRLFRHACHRQRAKSHRYRPYQKRQPHHVPIPGDTGPLNNRVKCRLPWRGRAAGGNDQRQHRLFRPFRRPSRRAASPFSTLAGTPRDHVLCALPGALFSADVHRLTPLSGERDRPLYALSGVCARLCKNVCKRATGGSTKNCFHHLPPTPSTGTM